MAVSNETMMSPAFEVLVDKVDGSKFALVTLAASRARQLQDYYGSGTAAGGTIPPQYPSLRKILSASFEEIAHGKIVAISGDEARAREAAKQAAREQAESLPGSDSTVTEGDGEG